jgi:hypothetical protein
VVFEWHISRPVKCQLKVMNIQVNQAPAKCWKIWELIHKDCHQTVHELADITGISYGVCQEILTENLNMCHIAPSSLQHTHPHIPESHRIGC